MPDSTDKPSVTPFSPKEQFQRFQPDSAESLAINANQKWLRVSLDSSLAQLAAVGASNAELMGARRLITTLLDLSETNTKFGKLPQIKLETYD